VFTSLLGPPILRMPNRMEASMTLLWRELRPYLWPSSSGTISLEQLNSGAWHCMNRYVALTLTS